MSIHFTEAEYKALFGEPEKAQNKYRNVRVEYDGLTFDSEHERDRYVELKILQRAGEISSLKLQPVFVLIPAVKENGKTVQRAITYKADFSYVQRGQTVVEDAKGVQTDVYKLKKKLMRAILGIKVVEV